MAGATVAPLARFPLFTTISTPVILAGGLTLGAQPGYQSYMPYPDGQGDVTWQGDLFGLTAPTGSNVWYIAVTVTYRVSSLAAFNSITAQLLINGSPVGTAASFTPSITPATGTVIYTGGCTPSQLSTLAVQVTFHQVQMGLGYVTQAYATADYSFADAIGIFTVGGDGAVAVVTPSVTPPATPYLVSQGAVAGNLTPSFGQPTTAKDLLIGWTFSNSNSLTFDTTVNNPAWTLIGSAGASFGWRGLWYKANCAANETAPVFSSGGAVTMSQLLEFGNVLGLDQSGTFFNSGSDTFTMSAGSRDTRSGNFVLGFSLWSALSPATVMISGTDSSAHALGLTTYTNAATTGQSVYALSWAQASLPVGPGTDSMSASLSIFGGSGGIIASFFADPAPVIIPPAMTWRSPVSRTIVIPVRAG